MSQLSLFRHVFRVSRWLRQRLSPTGLLVANLTAFAGAFGLDTQANLAHELFTLGVVLLLVDALACRRCRCTLDIRRTLPAFATVDQVSRYTLHVHNTGHTALRGLCLHEELHQPFPPATGLRIHRPAAGLLRHLLTYADWLDVLRRLRVLDLLPLALPALAPGQQHELTVTVTPRQRGLAMFAAVRISQSGPLGLWLANTWPELPQAQSLAVLPARHVVPPIDAAGRRHLQPGGLTLALRVGNSEEFHSLRDYRPGDPLRSIHWRTWARTGKPAVREHHDEFFARHALVLDTATDSLFDPALEAAIALAVSFVLRQRDADSLLDLLFVAGHVHQLTAGRGLGHPDGLLRVLASLQPTPHAHFARLAATVTASANRLSSLVCILLDWNDERRHWLGQLQALGVVPLVYLVGRPAPPSPGLPICIVDPQQIDASLAAR